MTPYYKHVKGKAKPAINQKCNNSGYQTGHLFELPYAEMADMAVPIMPFRLAIGRN